ncbi:hypothetical protein [Paraburkholderia metrosideri]|jgi:hypothetical protein|uniref:Outer membrane protein beta-barrel domain-containing protein n=1 Tax=Paraburkholderia metrosideri TaxID=580937 RepID=A0ABM8NYM1_9BURK|nr:hypothetical protein [Paraburkholderia metrosideri]CAD6549464.1 hypothetical protein LMG28140_04764 [Paraburkholderia metrosideri]
MHFRQIKKNIRRTAVAFVVSLAGASAAHADNWCGGGIWVDAMLGSYHIDPDPNTNFNEFNPGLGVECWFNNQWAVTVGGFRNSLRRPSYYGGGVWAPEFAHWGIVRIAAMGGIISGYNYGNWGLGHNHSVGPVVAPIVMLDYKRVGANFIVIPPIPSDNLPFTIGFQVKVKF